MSRTFKQEVILSLCRNEAVMGDLMKAAKELNPEPFSISGFVVRVAESIVEKSKRKPELVNPLSMAFGIDNSKCQPLDEKTAQAILERNG